MRWLNYNCFCCITEEEIMFKSLSVNYCPDFKKNKLFFQNIYIIIRNYATNRFRIVTWILIELRLILNMYFIQTKNFLKIFLNKWMHQNVFYISLFNGREEEKVQNTLVLRIFLLTLFSNCKFCYLFIYLPHLHEYNYA